LFEHQIQAHAAERLDEVKAPLRDLSGTTLLALRGSGTYAAVLPYIVGTTGHRDARARVDSARLLARFHRTMYDVHVSGGTRSTRSVGVLGWLRERILTLAQDASLAHKLDWDAVLAATTGAAARVAALACKLPHTIVHGDVHPANFVRDGERSVGLLDFDFAHESERAYDVAIGVDEFGRTHNDAALDLAAAASFRSAYADELALSSEERAAIPDLMIRRNATMVWYIVTRHGQRVPGDVGGGLCRTDSRNRTPARGAV